MKAVKSKRTCSKGHVYFKSSDCKVCPVCEKERVPAAAFLAAVSAPARRALESKGILSLKILSGYKEEEILQLHGVGPGALPLLRSELLAKGLSFRENRKLLKPVDVEAYIRSFPPVKAKLLTRVRNCIKKAAPKAKEVISYSMPGYKWNGMLVWFACHANHIGFYPGASGIAAFKKELSVYKGARGSVQFPLNEPLPLKLIDSIVRYRMKQNEIKSVKK